ncbi:MAG: PDDEXK nuclease domain-containing protein [Bdellovibrionota bacterium]
MIHKTKEKTWQQINKNLISLYGEIGKGLSQKTKFNGWGKNTVEELSKFIQTQDPSSKGFSPRNLWRMKQFYEEYEGITKLSAVLTEITWTNHLHILSKTKSIEEKEFYVQLAAKHHYSERDFARIIDSCTYERTILADKKLPPALTEFPANAKGVFKDKYMFEFLNLQDDYKEIDLQKSLIKKLSKFLLELGRDFTLVGEEFTIQIGMKDFRIDILMFHRELNCLVAIELKISEFKPEHIGKMQFYLEALDQKVKKKNENPSIGIIICKTKDEEVVQFAMNRNISPTIVAEYETKILDKKILQNKLHELLAMIEEDQ